MQCARCRNDAVFFQPYSGRHLCGRHLVMDIETRAKRTIRVHHWLCPGDHIAVPLSGDRKSAALLTFLRDLTIDRRDVQLSAVPSAGSRTAGENVTAARHMAGTLRVPCLEPDAAGEIGTPEVKPVTRIAIPLSLDDIALGILGEFLFGDITRLVTPVPQGQENCPQLICPFIAVPDTEIALYGELKRPGIRVPAARPADGALREETINLLEKYSQKHPATKHALLHLAEELARGDVAGIAGHYHGRGVSGDGI